MGKTNIWGGLGRKARMACAVLISAVLLVALTPPAPAQAMGIKSGQWIVPTDMLDTKLYKMSQRVDTSLKSQLPSATMTAKTSGKKVTVTVKVKEKGSKVLSPKNTTKKVKASVVGKVRMPNLYRKNSSNTSVCAGWVLCGDNNYGTLSTTDSSAAVGKNGRAKVTLRYEGCIWKYSSKRLTRSYRLREVYWNRTVDVTIGTVKVPKGCSVTLKVQRV